MNTDYPSHIFLIPYRDREDELKKWQEHMIPYLNNQIGEENYKIYVIHQIDSKMFNRGGLCNIGFLYAKKQYPNNYKDIQLVIHDVDIYPIKKENEKDIIIYSTKKNEARHPYGVLRPNLGGTLGGICIIYGEDYEKVSGMPNFYGWGGEDVGLSRRCQVHKIHINEDNFIDRRSTSLIVDPESHDTLAKKKIIMVTDKLNLKKVMYENSLNPQNGLNNIKFSVIEKKNINDLQNWIMLNVNFIVL